MRISERERNCFRRLVRAGDLRQNTPDLFLEEQKAQRRRSHLILIIQRKSRQLKINSPTNLGTKSELELETIRRELSRQIAHSKMSQMEAAA